MSVELFHFILPPHFVCEDPENIGSNEIRDASWQESHACKFMKGTPYQYRYQSRVRKTNNGEAPRLWWELRKWSPATCTQAANIRCLMELVWTPHGSSVHTKPPAATTLQKWDPSLYRGLHLAPTSAWWRALPGEGGSDRDSSWLWSCRLPPHTGSEQCWLSAPRFLPSCLCRGTKTQVLTKVRNTEMSTKKKTLKFSHVPSLR